MLGKKMHAALNEHVNAELYSAYLYLSMSTYFEDTNLRGFSRWMQLQAKESHSINRDERTGLQTKNYCNLFAIAQYFGWQKLGVVVTVAVELFYDLFYCTIYGQARERRGCGVLFIG